MRKQRADAEGHQARIGELDEDPFGLLADDVDLLDAGDMQQAQAECLGVAHRGDQVAAFARQHGLLCTTVEAITEEGAYIANDAEVDASTPGGRQILLITGPNMAGKSALLRQTALIVLMAQMGSYVPAEAATIGIIDKVFTRVGASDNLSAGESTFMVEMNETASILNNCSERSLILLDEILKGTNSTDKQAGSVALVKQLVDHPCLTIIATHDLALGELEQVYPGRILNYCFEANIENDHLSFDYKLKRGLAQKMNATFLMKKMGIIT